MKPFVHLHTHSHYSLLDGLSKVDEMVKLAKKFEMPALAITDHGNMHGAIEFYKLAQKEGIKAIIGVEAYIANRTRFDKVAGVDNKRYHLTLLAKNLTGYKNLIKMVSKSHLEGYYYKPRMDKDLLREFHEGIICLSGCLGGELGRAMQQQDYEEGERIAQEYQSIFGAGNYFLEIMHHTGIEDIANMRRDVITLSKKTGIPLVATQDSHYLHTDDHKAHDTFLAVQTDSTGNDANKFSFGSMDASFISSEQAHEFFKDVPEAVENTLKIAEMCNVEIELGKWVFPNLPIEPGTTYEGELRTRTFAGIPRRGLTETAELLKRVEYELKVINDKGYAPYFMVVADLLRFAKEKGILTTIRGSVAGSMVTYLNFITNVDPMVYDLPFERFLYPERPSAPDIDMDFADNRREEMIEYVKQKYGADHVAQLGTFGTMMARGAVRDVARALGHPYVLGDTISKLIPLGSQGFPMTIAHAMELEPELKKMYDTQKDVKEIIDLAQKMEGCVRHVSVHAAGVVISPTPLTDYTPIQFDPKGGKIITQYDMYVIEDVGLLKFDFLGIRNLAILADAVHIVQAVQNIAIDIENVPLEDKKTFSMLAKGETMGLFQLNGSGMTRFLKELRPSTIHDINAMVALYRPGPMETIPDYIKRKHNPELVTFLDPRMKTILYASYGVITYQDDVLLIAIHLAGYSWLEVDKLRKAMGKKIPAEMEAQKTKLLEGFVKNGLSEAKAQELWLLIEPFAAYGFNKSHAASYGKVAYQTAYMKANFPAEYMTAVLTAESGDIEEVAAIIDECKRMQIPVLPPDINESVGDFTVLKKKTDTREARDEIRFGLYTIKNLGKEIADAIIAERNAKGPFTSYANFLDRIKHKNLNKKSLEALIKAGAMDTLGERGQMLFNLDDALAYNREGMRDGGAQGSLFGLLDDQKSVPTLTLKYSEPAPMIEKLAWEKELLGLYISGHPLERFKDKFAKQEKDIKAIKKGSEGSAVVFGGMIESMKMIFTKKNEHMAFLKIADFGDNIEVVVFPRTLVEYKEIIKPDMCVALRGKLSFRQGEPSIVAEAFKELRQEVPRQASTEEEA